jgi:hypothetical protein
MLALGAAVASAKIAEVISGIELDDLLRPVGLSKRRSTWPRNLAFASAGLLGGGVIALMFAPEGLRGAVSRLHSKRNAKTRDSDMPEIRDGAGAKRPPRPETSNGGSENSEAASVDSSTLDSRSVTG